MVTIYAATIEEAREVAEEHDLGDRWSYGGTGRKIEGYE